MRASELDKKLSEVAEFPIKVESYTDGQHNYVVYPEHLVKELFDKSYIGKDKLFKSQERPNIERVIYGTLIKKKNIASRVWMGLALDYADHSDHANTYHAGYIDRF